MNGPISDVTESGGEITLSVRFIDGNDDGNPIHAGDEIAQNSNSSRAIPGITWTHR